jgi:sodium transport system permease protein
MISIFSALARSVKEAQTYILPLMVVVMLVGITGMFGHVSGGSLLYLIPIYNSVQCMSGIFSFELSRVHVMITVISNIVYCGILAFVLTKMFHSEKVMFAR